MKLLLAVSCLVVAVVAKPLLGTEQCAKGPQVWCVDVRSASQCGAVTHCQQNVWNKPVLKTVPCDMCKEVITIVENFLKDNVTQSEMLAFLEKLCDLIPDPSLTSQCKELVNTYFSVLMSIIKEELGNPSVACSALHLCTSLQQHLADLKSPQQLLSNEIPDVDMSKVVYPFMANLPLLLNPQNNAQEAPKNSDVCKDCLQLVNDVQESLKTNSSFGKSLIENALKECDLLGGISDICKTYVNQYAELVIQMIIQMDQPAQQICSTAGFCTQEKAAPMLEMTPAKVIVPAVKLQPAVKITEKQFDTICEICELILTQLEDLLNKNYTQEHIKKVLKEICDFVPSKHHDQCVDFIDTYSRMIIELLEQELSPKQMCVELGCCSSRGHKSVKLSSEKIQSGGYCPVCKMIVTYMDKILSENVTQERIKTYLHVVCNSLPDTMIDECSALVDAYEALFIELLLQEMDPALVCRKMSLCTNKAKPLLGSEKCMWGPSYWCKDLETAGSCNAIEHCKRHVWN